MVQMEPFQSKMKQHSVKHEPFYWGVLYICPLYRLTACVETIKSISFLFAYRTEGVAEAGTPKKK